MTEQQANLFKLFKEIDAVCKKNNIDYCLAGGSAIGPVRHGSRVHSTKWLRTGVSTSPNHPAGLIL